MATPQTVLLVEDDPNDAILIQRCFRLANLGLKLIVLSDGQQAVRYLSGSGPYHNRDDYPLPALMLLDLGLPMLDGFQVIEWVRNESELCHLPIIVLTASVFSPDVQRAYALGANSFLVKPADAAELVTMLQSIADYWLVTCRLPEQTDSARIAPQALPLPDEFKTGTGSG